MSLTPEDLDRIATVKTIDITTFGRRSGLPRRLEIWWFRVEGRFVITGSPGRRDWLANLRSDPRMIVHVDGLDIEAMAREVDDQAFKRIVFTQPETSWYSTMAELDRLVASAPMVELELGSPTPNSP